MNRHNNKEYVSFLISFFIALFCFIFVIGDRVLYNTAFEDNTVPWITIWANIILCDINLDRINKSDH